MILATISVIWYCWRIKKWDKEKSSLNFAMPFPFPFPIIPGNNIVSFPFPKFGNGISIPVPIPKNWEWNFHSRSQKLGMKFIIPVPKVWKWAEPFPFPFPNVQKSFPLTPDIFIYWGSNSSIQALLKAALPKTGGLIHVRIFAGGFPSVQSGV